MFCYTTTCRKVGLFFFFLYNSMSNIGTVLLYNNMSEIGSVLLYKNVSENVFCSFYKTTYRKVVSVLFVIQQRVANWVFSFFCKTACPILVVLLYNMSETGSVLLYKTCRKLRLFFLYNSMSNIGSVL
jgi:hypothetical protein